MNRIILFITCVMISFLAHSQSADLPIDQTKYHLIDRLDIKYGHKNNILHTSIKPYKRDEIIEFIEAIEADTSIVLDDKDKANIAYFKSDSWEFITDSTEGDSKKPFLKELYKKRADFYSYHGKDFDVHINPVLHVAGGKETKEGRTIYTNTRGVEVRGSIDEKVGYYAYIAETQVKFPNYVNSYIGRNQKWVVPGEGFWKKFKEDGYDFLHARGYFTFDFTKHINFKFGHDKNFVGNGYRSLIMSDFATPAPFIKLQTKVWKIKYTNLFTDMISGVESNQGGTKNGRFPRKFIASHHLSIDLVKNFNLGFFETIVYSRGDSAIYPGYDINYFNPVIFYRSIEQNLGSSDNAILGMDFKWNIAKRVSLYGQIVLDEFKLEEIKANNGWWGNKYGIQLGAKYIDAFGLKSVDLQGEMNLMRPFTYSHSLKSSGYTHYHQSLAHPLGANFNELIGILRWQATNKLFVVGKGIYTIVGFDTSATQGYGQDLLKPYTTRVSDHNNTIGQGAQSNIIFMDLTLSYMLKHNLFLDLQSTIRKETNDVAYFEEETMMFTMGLRWNISKRLMEF